MRGKLRLHTTHLHDFGMVQDAYNIYNDNKNQARRLCVGGDMVILLWNEPKVKWPYLRLHTTYALDFGTVIDIVTKFLNSLKNPKMFCGI